MASLDDEWYPTVPWPRYSRKVTFRHNWPAIIVLA